MCRRIGSRRTHDSGGVDADARRRADGRVWHAYLGKPLRWRDYGCLRRSLLIGQLHPYNRGGHEESHPPVHLSHEPDRWDGVRYLRV